MTVLPLDGVRVIELATWVAAPSATAIMADLGADVVKVEPPAGDAWRYPGMIVPGGRWSTAFELDNRGKRSVVVDLAHEGGSALVKRLCASADIFVTNLTASRQRLFGLTAADVHQVAPRVVHASLTAYGLEGPDAERAGFDNAAFWARTGIMGIVGQPDCPPGMFRGGQGDHTAGLALFGACLAALRARDRSGQGQVVDASLFAAGLWTIGSDYSRSLINGQQPEFRDRSAAVNPLANTYRCADGRWLALVMPQSDRYWPALCRAVEHPEWEAHPDYATLDQRRINGIALTSALDAVIGARALEEWRPILDGAGLIWEPMSTVPEVLQDPQAEVTHRFVDVEAKDGRRFRTVNTPFAIAGADMDVRSSAPDLGADTADVLAECGIDADEAAAIAASGALG